MEPVCCWATAASGAMRAATSQSFFVILVLLVIVFLDAIFRGIGRLSPVGCVRNGVVDSCFGEGAKAQDATFACSACGLAARIAGPRYMEGCAEFKAAADYLMLAHG